MVVVLGMGELSTPIRFLLLHDGRLGVTLAESPVRLKLNPIVGDEVPAAFTGWGAGDALNHIHSYGLVR